jgi:hypothetical protein
MEDELKKAHFEKLENLSNFLNSFSGANVSTN